MNSDSEEYSKGKIILDETVNPKRPLRPNRLTNHNSVSSPSNSNQSSRPASHISGEELSQQLNTSINNNNANVMADDISVGRDEIDMEIEKSSMKPPPKPPKPNNMKKIISNTSLILHGNSLDESNSNNSSFNNSNQNLSNTPTSKNNNQTKSNTSLNNIQFKNLSSKTTSDSILNRVSRCTYKIYRK